MSLDAYILVKPAAAIKQSSDDKSPIEIKGESSDAAGEKSGAFEINDFKWSVSSVKEEKITKSDGTKGKKPVATTASDQHRVVSVPQFKISKPFDAASLGLFRACLDTECVFKQVIVVFRKTTGGAPFTYLCYTFGNVRVDSVEWSIKGLEQSDAKPDHEDVSFSCETCEISYFPQGQTGAKTEVRKTANYSRDVINKRKAAGQTESDE